jgi:hypothetical protein
MANFLKVDRCCRVIIPLRRCVGLISADLAVMELYAAKRVKKQEEKLKLEKIETDAISTLPAPSLEQRMKLDRLFGFPEPPHHVYGITLTDETVGVWWIPSSKNTENEIILWEIHRYRKEKHEDVWRYKGFEEIKYLKKLKQGISHNLQNGYEVTCGFFLPPPPPRPHISLFHSTNSQ